LTSAAVRQCGGLAKRIKASPGLLAINTDALSTMRYTSSIVKIRRRTHMVATLKPSAVVWRRKLRGNSDDARTITLRLTDLQSIPSGRKSRQQANAVLLHTALPVHYTVALNTTLGSAATQAADAKKPSPISPRLQAAFGSLKGKQVFGDAVEFEREMREEWQ
jgi:hypothetical protein